MLNKIKCSRCYFYDKCECLFPCEMYTPLGGIFEDKMIFDYIEKERVAFFDEWFKYISEYSD